MVSSTAYYIKFDGFSPTFFNQFLVVMQRSLKDFVFYIFNLSYNALYNTNYNCVFSNDLLDILLNTSTVSMASSPLT
jgi:hypothetical protein